MNLQDAILRLKLLSHSGNSVDTEAIARILMELDCYRDATIAAMDESCDANEKHCTCVPILRQKVKELEDQLSQQSEEIQLNWASPYVADGMHKRIKYFEETYSIFEECSPPDVPLKQFVKDCFRAWEILGSAKEDLVKEPDRLDK